MFNTKYEFDKCSNYYYTQEISGRTCEERLAGDGVGTGLLIRPIEPPGGILPT